jgi:hypothetical protein
MNKKGSLDNLYVMAQIFGFAIFIVVVLVAWNYLTSSQTQTLFWDLSPTSSNVMDDAQKGFNQFDNIFMLVYFAYHLGVLGLSYLLRSHPVFLVVIILIMIVGTLISPILSNSFETVLDNSEFTSIKSDLPKTIFIMSRLPLFELIWIFITGIVMVGLSRE